MEETEFKRLVVDDVVSQLLHKGYETNRSGVWAGIWLSVTLLFYTDWLVSLYSLNI